MPRHPHVGFQPTERRLEDFFDELPVLRELDEQGRLVWYNAATRPPVGDSPVIGVRYFSSEAAMNILGEMGVNDGPHARASTAGPSYGDGVRAT